MLPMKEELFSKQIKQDPVIFQLMNSTGKYSITVKSRYHLSEDQLDTIISIVEGDVTKRVKPFDMAIDISLYTGFCDIKVTKKSNDIEVIIN